MPGVIVTTSTQSGPSTPLRAASGQLFLVGTFELGNTDRPIRVRNKSDVVRLLGGRVPYSTAYDVLMNFFDTGGQQAQVARVVGPAATSGTLTLQDRNSTTTAPTLKIDAVSAGLWSTRLAVEIVDGTVANTYKLNVYFDDVLVETYSNLTTPADAVVKTAKSTYIKVSDLASETDAPDNNPAVLTKTVLSSGADDHAAIVASNYTDALELFDKQIGAGAVAIPGQTSSAVWDAVIAHCQINDRVAIFSGDRGDSSSDLQAKVAGYNTEYAGVFAPWIVVTDAQGVTRTISPEGYVAGARATAHDQYGSWRVPAGSLSSNDVVTGVDQTFTDAERDALDDAGVSVIKQVNSNIGVRLYGYRSLSHDRTNYEFLSIRDLLNWLEVAASEVLEEYVFESIDRKGHLQAQLEGELKALVDPIAKAGGLFPRRNEDTQEEIDPGYKVDTGDTVNSPETLAMSRIRAVLSVRPAPVASWIELTIVKVAPLGAM